MIEDDRILLCSECLFLIETLLYVFLSKGITLNNSKKISICKNEVIDKICIICGKYEIQFNYRQAEDFYIALDSFCKDLYTQKKLPCDSLNHEQRLIVSRWKEEICKSKRDEEYLNLHSIVENGIYLAENKIKEKKISGITNGLLEYPTKWGAEI